eukprot:snap_masked-scaffold_40-processed-gene-1.39-mRNA-1 protein AED:1.00 eAED:1.00 QI:0/0/0/0/1/1/2/0/869
MFLRNLFGFKDKENQPIDEEDDLISSPYASNLHTIPSIETVKELSKPRAISFSTPAKQPQKPTCGSSDFESFKNDIKGLASNEETWNLLKYIRQKEKFETPKTSKKKLIRQDTPFYTPNIETVEEEKKTEENEFDYLTYNNLKRRRSVALSILSVLDTPHTKRHRLSAAPSTTTLPQKRLPLRTSILTKSDALKKVNRVNKSSTAFFTPQKKLTSRLQTPAPTPLQNFNFSLKKKARSNTQIVSEIEMVDVKWKWFKDVVGIKSTNEEYDSIDPVPTAKFHKQITKEEIKAWNPPVASVPLQEVSNAPVVKQSDLFAKFLAKQKPSWKCEKCYVQNDDMNATKCASCENPRTGSSQEADAVKTSNTLNLFGGSDAPKKQEAPTFDFGGSSNGASSTLFGATKTEESTPSFSFGSKPDSTTEARSEDQTTISTGAPLFGATEASKITSIFGNTEKTAAAKESSKTTVDNGLFGDKTKDTSVDKAQSTVLFGTTSAKEKEAFPKATSLFGGQETATEAKKENNLFGATSRKEVSSSTSTLFGDTKTEEKQGSLFGTGASTKEPSAIFTGSTNNNSTESVSKTEESLKDGVKGAPAGNIFGSVSEAKPSTSLFGQSVPPSTAPTTNLFGSSTNVEKDKPTGSLIKDDKKETNNSGFNLFGNDSTKTATSSNTTSIFGSTAQPQQTSAAPFGANPQESQKPLFGSAPASSVQPFGSTATPATSSIPFGTATPAAASGPFGGGSSSSTPFGNSGSTPFGNSGQGNSNQTFGGSATTSNNSNPFSSTATAGFGASGGMFGTSGTKRSGFGEGANTQAGSMFGTGNSLSNTATPAGGGFSIGGGGFNSGTGTGRKIRKAKRRSATQVFAAHKYIAH